MESTTVVPSHSAIGSKNMEKADAAPVNQSMDTTTTASTTTTTGMLEDAQEGSVKHADVPTEDGEGEGEDEEGETRCICGELDTPDDSGFFIQCEQCSAWQHGYCVSITQDNAPDKYWCEQCRPELHQLFTTDTGEPRSIYKPVQEKKRQSRRKARNAATSKPLAANEVEKSPKSPSNTDENIDDIGDEEDEIDEDETSGLGLAKDGNSRSSRRRRRNSTDETSMDQYSLDGGDSDKKLQDRKRATFMAREEKQYQRMLEKALKESRRTSHQDDPDIEDNNGNSGNNDENHLDLPDDTTRLQPDVIPTEDKPDSLANDDLKDTLLSSKESSMEKSKDVEKEASQENDSSISSVQDIEKTNEPIPPLTSISSSEDDLRKAGSSRGSKRVSKPVRKSNRTRRSNTSSDTNQNRKNADIGTDKPVKPRLPPQRTSLNEMRRRVSAILEFISRTQWELSEDQSDREEFVRFVENQHFVEKVDTIYNGYKESLSMMDDLTRELLLWEKKYSNNSNAIQ
ncbi:cti6p [Saccharomyces arboricola H-6]|uniref:Cti6p n=1 Tax=Saccharomyces arboricola (strain H-6 / AS 2.3317 / CBS 10644) TaxID=1160507 RepID=J8LHE5_SACAR|nr:cti6p [Saccharomyces arboricola H-6]